MGVNVTKASGDLEAFDESKLRSSLSRANADPGIIDEIVETVTGQLYEGISTYELYRKAFRMLRRRSSGSAGRYKLKQALMELGPSGYPFELFVSGLLQRLGYRTQTGVTMKGTCISHEIDVIAQTDREYYIMECKFHNRNNHKVNVRVPLYIRARFLDLDERLRDRPGPAEKNRNAWLVTNTRFTSEALEYGNCVGMKMLGWDHPENGGLRELIDSVALHPVTCLSTLSAKQKQRILEEGVVFSSQLAQRPEVLEVVGLDDSKRQQVLKEAEEISR